MEINKLIGYTEIETVDGVLGVKIGAYTLENVCEDFGVDLEQMNDLMNIKEVTNEQGETFVYQFPKKPVKFMASILNHGVNYVSKHTNGKEYPLDRAYEWIDGIGIGSDKFNKIFSTFLHAARTGVVLPIDEEEDPKKVKKKASNMGKA